MAVLSLDPDYLRRLVLKVRAFMGKEDTEVPEAAWDALNGPWFRGRP